MTIRFVIHDAEADVLDLPCEECGNEKSAAQRTKTTGLCAFCLNEKVRELRRKHRDRYKREPIIARGA